MGSWACASRVGSKTRRAFNPMKTLLRQCCVLWCAILTIGVVEGAAPSTTSMNAKIDRLILEAGELAKKGDLAGAEAKMTELIQMAPQEPMGYFNRALMRYRLGQQEVARQDIDKHLQLQPGGEDALELRARIRSALNDLNGALSDLNSVLAKNQERHSARFLRARILAARKDHHKAMEDYERLVRADIDNDELIASRAESALALGDNSAARLSLKKLTERHPENGWAHYKLGQAKFGLMEFEEAIASYRRAAELKWEAAGTLRAIGNAQFGLADYNGAIESLKESIAAAPSPYAILVLHLALRRADRSVGESPLRDALPGWDSEWTQSVGRYLLGEIRDSELVDRAHATKDRTLKDEQLCEAYYYIGATRLLEMDRVAGEVLFERVLGTRASSFIEYTFARAELRRMKRG